MNYIIGNKIEFAPDSQKIRSLETGKTTKLHYTSCRCLELLIQEHGNIVSQHQLIEYGWEERAMGVSSAAYYQCLLNLRKALKSLGMEDVIRTIPRKGVMFTLQCPVRKEGTESVATQSTSSPVETPTSSLRLETILSAGRKRLKKISYFFVAVGVFITFFFLSTSEAHSTEDKEVIYHSKKDSAIRKSMLKRLHYNAPDILTNSRST